MLHLPFLLFVGRINGRILFQRKLTLRLPANNNINISDKAAIQRPPISPMSKFRSLIAYALFGMLVSMSMTNAADALDVNGSSASKGNSMDDVAKMIRKSSRWQILEAVPKKKGEVMRYRFKLINSTGKVKIINVDPLRPNLRKLEQ